MKSESKQKCLLKSFPEPILHEYSSILISNAGTSSGDEKRNGVIGAKALGYILATNSIGMIIGVVFGSAIKPGI